MIDPGDVPPVDAGESLARFVFSKHYVRKLDSKIKPDAFIPYPHRDLSVTRHLHADQQEIWRAGDAVAAARNRTLYGRGDVLAGVCIRQRLTVLAAPLDGNPNHAEISGWPVDDKPAQKAIAMELAAAATYTPKT